MPPILQTPGLVVTGTGIDPSGHAYIKLATLGRSTHPVREVVIIIATTGSFEYQYSIYDRSIAQITTYRGPFGDPEQDTWIENRSLHPKP